jgi:Tfp pilus tip-associated adhesin PilY1
MSVPISYPFFVSMLALLKKSPDSPTLKWLTKNLRVTVLKKRIYVDGSTVLKKYYYTIYSNVGIIIMVLEAIGHGLLALNINEP